MGRFINRDPLGYIDGMSLYGGYFAEVFGVDPSGTWWFDIGPQTTREFSQVEGITSWGVKYRTVSGKCEVTILGQDWTRNKVTKIRYHVWVWFATLSMMQEYDEVELAAQVSTGLGAVGKLTTKATSGSAYVFVAANIVSKTAKVLKKYEHSDGTYRYKMLKNKYSYSKWKKDGSIYEEEPYIIDCPCRWLDYLPKKPKA
jgi:hypothetical protein